MRILAIRGCNLASLEGEFEIDFTTEPLRSAGIFAITGSTGSGKSTILDAVCLALFNDTPRISKAERENIADVRDTTLSLGDSRNILRRGTGNGYAEVDFISLSGDKYRSRWSVRRARDKADGSMQDWNIDLINLTNGEIQQGSKTELLNKIKELIGLTFDQFTRAVMLAQGDFATFLKAGKNEKADLLEKLTGTDIYSRISKQIYDNTQGAKADLEFVERNIEGVELLSDEQLTAYDEELQAIVAELKSLEEQEKAQTKKIEWIDAEEIDLPINFANRHPFDNGDMYIRDEVLLPHYRNEDAVKADIANYYAMVSEVDIQIGRIIDALKESGKYENTIIILASDNGLAVGQHGLLGKQNLYEHSISVPLVISIPDGLKGVETSAYCYLGDIYPTICDVLNIEKPQSITTKSFAKTLQNPELKHRKQLLLKYSSTQRALVRDGWKYITYNVDGIETEQLFNLNNDPWEMVNLANDEKFEFLKESYRRELKNEMRKNNDFCDLDKPMWGHGPKMIQYKDIIKIYEQ